MGDCVDHEFFVGLAGERVLPVLGLNLWLGVLVTTFLSSLVVNSKDIGVLSVAFASVIFRINGFWSLERTHWFELALFVTVNLLIGRRFLLQLVLRKVVGDLF